MEKSSFYFKMKGMKKKNALAWDYRKGFFTNITTAASFYLMVFALVMQGVLFLFLFHAGEISYFKNLENGEERIDLPDYLLTSYIIFLIASILLVVLVIVLAIVFRQRKKHYKEVSSMRVFVQATAAKPFASPAKFNENDIPLTIEPLPKEKMKQEENAPKEEEPLFDVIDDKTKSFTYGELLPFLMLLNKSTFILVFFVAAFILLCFAFALGMDKGKFDLATITLLVCLILIVSFIALLFSLPLFYKKKLKKSHEDENIKNSGVHVYADRLENYFDVESKEEKEKAMLAITLRYGDIKEAKEGKTAFYFIGKMGKRPAGFLILKSSATPECQEFLRKVIKGVKR